MNEINTAIEDLRRCATTINEIANRLAEEYNAEETEPTEPVRDEPELTLEAVRAVLAEKSRAGFTDQIRSLLRKYGAEVLSGIDPEHYKALLIDVEGLTNAT
ncbi:MAG: DNA ligase [Eubacteriales bacterium]